MKLLRSDAEEFLGEFTTKIVAIFNIKFYFVFITMSKVTVSGDKL